MNKDQLLEKLDLNKDGMYNVDDVIALANKNEKKLLFIGVMIGLGLGLMFGSIFL